MTRKVFMETLERMLSDVSFNDRYDALSYYKEYLMMQESRKIWLYLKV